jgi:hypothetical protein
VLNDKAKNLNHIIFTKEISRLRAQNMPIVILIIYLCGLYVPSQAATAGGNWKHNSGDDDGIALFKYSNIIKIKYPEQD